jgi:hypothetical protein
MITETEAAEGARGTAPPQLSARFRGTRFNGSSHFFMPSFKIGLWKISRSDGLRFLTVAALYRFIWVAVCRNFAPNSVSRAAQKAFPSRDRQGGEHANFRKLALGT